MSSNHGIGAKRFVEPKAIKVTMYVCRHGHRHAAKNAAIRCNTGFTKPKGFISTEEARNLFWDAGMMCSNTWINGFGRIGLLKPLLSSDNPNAKCRKYYKKTEVSSLVRKAKKLNASAALALVQMLPVKQTYGHIQRSYRDNGL